ncbi:hypothetical protein [Cellulosimicrobium cellulans]|uniref:hypothetical protein n=1 Tax=Cellulosimicrobium cellulans TaxID=1710 RepID=UPI0020CC865C|nr:hypothetical protein NMQ07_00500 [Cellulosimicrobium cellulans]
MVGQVFVDESKARAYLLVAAVVLPGSMNTARRVVRDLTMPRQPRIHMKRESDARRRKILEAFVGLAPEVTVYRAGGAYRTELERRERCLRALVEDIARDRRTHLCLERDESLVQRDRRHLIEATRAAGCSESLAYRHESATAEPLLALPDAIAWAWARGTSWRQRCEPVVSRVVDL